jgi:hypothetical protein
MRGLWLHSKSWLALSSEEMFVTLIFMVNAAMAVTIFLRSEASDLRASLSVRC